ncbi:MAG TPA: hypothetical protein VGU22_12085 [Methylomirabilota bacterium]|nr:hypothetical protein [Methylomirabilota bacterium]
MVLGREGELAGCGPPLGTEPGSRGAPGLSSVGTEPGDTGAPVVPVLGTEPGLAGAPALPSVGTEPGETGAPGLPRLGTEAGFGGAPGLPRLGTLCGGGGHVVVGGLDDCASTIEGAASNATTVSMVRMCLQRSKAGATIRR